jgi:S-adenosylmethionine hydrolase
VTRSGLVTLTTDFGAGSAYAGSLRGALYAAWRDVTPVDITHDIRPFDRLEGALVLRAAAPHFPRGTVHLAVVDPGVGSARRPLLVAAPVGAGEQYFVGPDNGLFTPFLGAGARAFAIAAAEAPGPLSATFHGRDLFAPVAARLAGGRAPETFGAPVADPVRLDWPEPVAVPGGWRGVVLQVDRFGNAITNLPGGLVPSDPAGAGVSLGIAGAPRVSRIVRTYADANPGDVVALVGSADLLEVAVSQGSAAERLGLAAGHGVTLELVPGAS